ncbi:bifunctional glutamate N-acetyltransferase/amino-acid acetyltransferase ArgJ [Salicola sp. Rm-C-2C1-2]|uniref:bifunctional glutamate N-acetyltransferase/amino-acid acetyltransferase ArgJ n=1 Tax=Salicola sp. Rm-C-2C1-2 TaxID=3141321 RepID=UPI0032E4A6A9
MAVNPGALPEFHPVPGVRLGTADAAINKRGSDDLVLVELAEGSSAGAVFTRNAFRAAPVLIAEQALAAGRPRYLLINTGNANAGTGEQGISDARACCRAVAEASGVGAEQVLPFSTGVIGEPLPLARMLEAIPQTVMDLDADGWAKAAPAIMTTDTVPKGATRRVMINGEPVHISGISKGAGMIRPNMATMLAFVTTDAAIPADVLNPLVRELAESSFNRITIDGDTSTNDACVLASTGQSAAHVLDASGQLVPALYQALASVFLELSHAIVRDAEGATRFVTVEVAGAADGDEACRVAFTVAESPLVKTALYAGDPNWGRILAAVGRAGIEDLALDGVSIHLDDVCIVRHGGRAQEYTEDAGQAVMDQEELVIRIDLGRGSALERVWTCDFSHEYVTINAEYRT